MTRKPGAIICDVRPGSLGEEIGLRPGDRLLTVDGDPLRDIIDYRFRTSEDAFSLEVERPNGEIWEFEVEKDPWEDLGLEFKDDLFDRPRLCQNRCVFCFLTQMPRGLRPTLYLRDDDYRLSFLHGNFITLTGISRDDLERIAGQRLSPLYVSVHATDQAVRRRLFGAVRVGGMMENLRYLIAAGIEIHAQLVLCPGINDGPVLEQSLNDLLGLGDRLASVGVVPVGLTKYRDPSSGLRPFTPAGAGLVIRQINTYRNQSRRLAGHSRVYAADEFFVLAGRPVPGRGYYEGFPQLENGIGLIRRFLDSARRAAKRLPKAIERPRRVTVVTGRSAASTLETILSPYRSIEGLTVEMLPVDNRFFGPTVTVAGLLTGQDVSDALIGANPGDRILIPSVCLKDGDLFLDDLSLDELRSRVNRLVLPVQPAGPDLARTILEDPE